MSTDRISERCSSSNFISIGKIKGYKLSFNKISKDKSGKANMVYTGDDSLVWGVIFNIKKEQKTLLDKAEGLGKGYDEFKLKITNDLEEEVECVSYIATDKKYINNDLNPHDWYKEHCLIGAKEHNLPPDYILIIENQIVN